MKSLHSVTTRYLLLASLLLFGEKIFSQDSSMLAMMDLIRIQANFNDSTNLSFSTVCWTTEKDSTGQYVTDSITGSYKVKGNKVKISIDSVTQIQNEQYQLTVFSEESIMVVQKPDFIFRSIFSKDFLDTAFQQFEVNALSLLNFAPGYKKLAISFKPQSPYSSYNIIYDTTNYRVLTLDYSIKENSDSLKTTIAFINYNTSSIADSTFSNSQYFTKNGESYIPTPAYSTYEIIEPQKSGWPEPPLP